jgi:hypothetical protein
MASSFLVYSDLTGRRAVTKVGGTNFTFPTFTGGEALSLSLRFCETKNGASTQVYPNIAGMRASIGFSDTPPTAGTFSLQVNGTPTSSLLFSASASDLQTAINATLPSGVTCSVRVDGIAFVIRFSDGLQRVIVEHENALDPVSLIRVRTTVLSNTVEHELTLLQAPLAATNVWSPVVPPAPSVKMVQIGAIPPIGTPTPTIQNLKIPATFQGTFVLQFGNLTTSGLSGESGTSQIATALNNLWNGVGQSVSVLNPQTGIAQIVFDGSAFVGQAQPLLHVSVLTAPPGDNTLLLDLNTSGCYEALRATDTVTGLYLEIEADILPDGQNSSDNSNKQTVTLFRQKVTLQRPINWPGLETASVINWAQPPGPSSYLPFDPSQVITGQQFYSSALGDGTSTSYTITHNLGTENLHLTLRKNATGALLIHGSDYHARVGTNTVTLFFPKALLSGEVVAVISTAGPTSAFVAGIQIDSAQVTGLSAQLASLTSTVNELSSILPGIVGAGSKTSSGLAVNFPLTLLAECIGYFGNVSPSGTTGYAALKLPNRPPSLLSSPDFDRELWSIPMNSSMLAIGRTLSIDWGVSLQALRANCGVSYNLVVEIGNYTENGSVSVTWNTGSPVFVQPIVMTEDLVTHSFGVSISRVLLGSVDTLRLDQQKYGITTGNNAAAPTTADFVIRCRLIGLSTESSQPDPRAWISYALMPSLTASNGASAAQASIK